MLVIQQADDRNHPVFASLSDPTGNNILRNRLCFSQTIAWAGRSQQAAVDFNSDHLIDSADLFRSVDKTDQERGWSYGGRFCLLPRAQTHPAPLLIGRHVHPFRRSKPQSANPRVFPKKSFVACPPPSGRAYSQGRLNHPQTRPSGSMGAITLRRSPRSAWTRMQVCLGRLRSTCVFTLCSSTSL